MKVCCSAATATKLAPTEAVDLTTDDGGDGRRGKAVASELLARLESMAPLTASPAAADFLPIHCGLLCHGGTVDPEQVSCI